MIGTFSIKAMPYFPILALYNAPLLHGRVAQRACRSVLPRPLIPLLPKPNHSGAARCSMALHIIQKLLLRFAYTLARYAQSDRTVYSVHEIPRPLQRGPASSHSSHPSYHHAPQILSELTITGLPQLLGSLLIPATLRKSASPACCTVCL